MPPKRGPICISVINMKGGVGKTTIAVSLARLAARHYSNQKSNRQVLAIDLDPQANMSQALMGGYSYRQFLDDKSPSIVEVFNGYQPPTSGSSSATNLDIASVVRTVGPRSSLGVLPSRFDFSNHLTSAIKPDPRCLARLIAEHFQDKDLVIIDCAPTESVFTEAAYHASRYVVVPVRPEFLATIGFPLLNDSLKRFRNSNQGHQIDVIGIIINDAAYLGNNKGGPERRTAMQEIKAEAGKNEWHIFKSQIKYSRGFPKLMRGDTSYTGDAGYLMSRFADEIFSRPELSELELGAGKIWR